MNKEKLSQTINSIYNWPLDPIIAWTIYQNLTHLVESECEATLDFLKQVVSFDKSQRMEYRNYLACDYGIELRPDELNQYILIIMIVLMEKVEV